MGKENVFDESGETLEAVEATETEGGEEQTEAAEGSEAAEAPAEGKFRIGSQTFQTEAEALAYSQAHIQALEVEKQIADAYQQGLRESSSAAVPAAQKVTPEPEPIDTEKFYSDPQAFVREITERAKREALQAVTQQSAQQAEDEQIWREFSHEHPMFADFREDVEAYAARNAQVIRGLVATKGRKSAYDHIATQMKVQFAKRAEVLKPVRELPNTRGAAPAGSKTGNVTPKTEAKKPLSFAEQVRSIRKGKAQ